MGERDIPSITARRPLMKRRDGKLSFEEFSAMVEGTDIIK